MEVWEAEATPRRHQPDQWASVGDLLPLPDPEATVAASGEVIVEDSIEAASEVTFGEATVGGLAVEEEASAIKEEAALAVEAGIQVDSRAITVPPRTHHLALGDVAAKVVRQ